MQNIDKAFNRCEKQQREKVVSHFVARTNKVGDFPF
jgi:hypothetical protein